MHIPAYMLNGQICPVTAAVGALGVATATVFALRSREKPSAGKFAAVTAMIFAAQMMNFPVQNGTSGHFLGGVFAASVLGTPFGVLAMSIVVAVQSLVFSDGGLNALGANILNMGIIGAGLSGFLLNLLKDKNNPVSAGNVLLVGAVSWLSVVAASFGCSVVLALSKTAEFSKVVPAMLGIHALIGIGEAVLTSALYLLMRSLNRSSSRAFQVGLPVSAAVVTALLAGPFASGYPDGLEWVAGKLSFLNESAPAFTGLFPDYILPFIKNPAVSSALAGLVGVGIVFLAVYLAGKLIRIAGHGVAAEKK